MLDSSTEIHLEGLDLMRDAVETLTAATAT
jgi:hypothetical protein